MIGGFITIIVSAMFQLHSLWQLDLSCLGGVWNSCEWNIARYTDLLARGFWRFAEVPFQDGQFFKSNIGNAYDLFLGMNYIGWGLGMVGTFLIMLGVILFYRANMLEAKGLLTNNGLDKPLFPQ